MPRGEGSNRRWGLVALVMAIGVMAAMITILNSRSAVVATPETSDLAEAPEVLAAALECPTGFASRVHEPVLLVHGTLSNPAENWGWNWARSLPSLQFPTCTVALPERATGDLQKSAEYVVAAIRAMATTDGRPIDVVGHSQGGLVAQWALRWWPDLRTKVDDVVSLGAPGNGVQGLDLLLKSPVCTPACHQMLPGSAFLAALGRPDPQPSRVSYTSISSQTDQIIEPVFRREPQAGSQSEILVQAKCPGRSVGHIEMVADAAVFALAIDALVNPGPGDAGRVDPAVCSQVLAPETDVLGKLRLDVLRFLGSFGENPKTPSTEPPLAGYVTR